MADNLNRTRGLGFRLDVAERLQQRTGQPVIGRGPLDVSFPSAGTLAGLDGWTLTSAADRDTRDWGNHLDNVAVAARADRTQLAAAILHRSDYTVGGSLVLMTLDSFARWIGDPR